MCGRHRQAEVVGGADRGHGDQFGRGALPIGQVALADLLADRDDDRFQPTMVPSPSARATATLTQSRDELGRVVELAL